MALFHIQTYDNLPQAMQPCTILPNKGIVSGVWYMGIREWPRSCTELAQVSFGYHCEVVSGACKQHLPLT